MKKLIFMCLASFALMAGVQKPNCFARSIHTERFKLSKYFFVPSGYIKNEALEDAYIKSIKTSKTRKSPNYVTVVLSDPAKYNVTEGMLEDIEKYTGEKIDFSSQPKTGVIHFSLNDDNIKAIEGRNITDFVAEKNNRNEDSLKTQRQFNLDAIENHILKIIGLEKKSDLEYQCILNFDYDILKEKGSRPQVIQVKNISGIKHKKTGKDVIIPVNRKFFLVYRYVYTKAGRTKVSAQKPKESMAPIKIIKMYSMERSTHITSNSLMSYFKDSLFSIKRFW